jgi:hypothetical protein
MRSLICFCLLFPLIASAAGETVRGGSGRRAGRGATTRASSPAAPGATANCTLAAAGRKALSAIYGTCAVGQTMQPNPSNDRLPDNGVCAGSASSDRDTRSLSALWARRPRSCGATGTPHYSQESPRMSVLRGNVIDAAPRGHNDCSAFVSSILHTSGSRISPRDRDYKAFSTAAIIGWGSGGDCFNVPRFSESTSLLPGDIVVARGGDEGHVIMVDRVGADPFGLRKVASVQQCDRQPNFNDWDFTITESTGKKVGGRKIGPSIWDAKGTFKSKSLSTAVHIARAYIDLYKSACREKFGVRSETKFQRGSYRSRLLRHRGTSDAQCRNPNPPKLRGEECVRSCGNN